MSKSCGNTNIIMVSTDSYAGRGDAATVQSTNRAKSISNNIDGKVTLVLRGSAGSKVCRDGAFDTLIINCKKYNNLFGKLFGIVRKNVQFFRLSCSQTKNSSAIYEIHNVLSLSGILLAKRYKKPIFFELNSPNEAEVLENYRVTNPVITKIFSLLMKWELKQSDHIFVQTKELKALIQQLYGPLPISIAPNGAYPPREFPVVANRKRLQCVYVTTIDRYHAVESILDTFSKISKVASLVLIGTGERLEEYKQKYAKYKNINFTGRLPHESVLQYISNADFGLAQYNLSSAHFKKFGFYFCPMKMIEYASLGKPTVFIGTPNSVVSDFIKNKACINIVSNQALTELIVELAKSPRKLLIDTTNCARKFSQEYTWDKIAEHIVGVMNVH